MESIKGLYGAALVTREGRPVFAAASDPSSADGLFQVASVGKQFCAATILLLAEDGRLDLDEPITRWYPGSRWSFSIRHLLSHTSGIGHWRDEPGWKIFEPIGVDERIELFQRAESQHKPGRGWIYSSPGYVILGDIVHRATGRSYADTVTARIIEPLELTATTSGVYPPNGRIGHVDGSPVPPRPHLTDLVGTGDIWSTTTDIARFLTALHGGRVLSEESLRAMRTIRAPLINHGILAKHGYALGVYDGRICGHRAYFHPGDNPGYSTFAGWLPDFAAAIVVLGDDEALNLDEVLTHLIVHAAGV